MSINININFYDTPIRWLNEYLQYFMELRLDDGEEQLARAVSEEGELQKKE